MKKFIETFLELTKQQDSTIIFNDFLDFIIDMFTSTPERYWSNKQEKYTEKEKELFSTLFNEWLIVSSEKISKFGWFDVLGTLYEDQILSKGKADDKKQFFTPPNVAGLLEELTVTATEDIGVGYDPTGGSGRNLLAFHVNHLGCPCFAQDLDYTACKMCVCNFLVHGVTGSVAWMDTLQDNDCREGWIINPNLNVNGKVEIIRTDNLNDLMFWRVIKQENKTKSNIKSKQAVLM